MPDSMKYPKGDRLKMGQDPEGQTKWYNMSSLQTVPYHIALFCWNQHSDKLVEHVGEGLHPHSIGL